MEKYIQFSYTVTGNGYDPTSQPGVPRGMGEGDEPDDDPEPDGYELLDPEKGIDWPEYYNRYIAWLERKTGMTTDTKWTMGAHAGFDLTYYNCDGMDPELILPPTRGPAEFLLFYPYQWVGGTHDLYTCPPDSTLVGDWGPKSGGWQVAGRRTHGVNIPVTTKILPTKEWNNTEIVPYTAMRVNKWRRPCTSNLPPTYIDKQWPYFDTPVPKVPVKNWDLCGYARGYCACRDVPKENGCRWCLTYFGIPICAREDRMQPALDQCELYWEGHVLGGDDLRNMTTGTVVPHVGDDAIEGNGKMRPLPPPPGYPMYNYSTWAPPEYNQWNQHQKEKTEKARQENARKNDPEEFKRRIKDINLKYGTQQDLDRRNVEQTTAFAMREPFVDPAWEKRVEEVKHPLNLTGLTREQANVLIWTKECAPPEGWGNAEPYKLQNF